MCGRYTYLFKWKQLHRLMDLAEWPPEELTPRYNVAPTQPAPVVRQDNGGRRVGAILRWGLVPSWADDPSIGNRMINARGETLAEKPAFRTAFAKRRCLVPVSGFYEWKPLGGAREGKQPYWIGRADREPFALAGLWEHRAKQGEQIESFTIITTAPNELLKSIHDRMPVVIAPEEYGRWLDPANQDKSALQELIRTCPTVGFEALPIGRGVNNPKFDDPSILAPLGSGKTEKTVK